MRLKTLNGAPISQHLDFSESSLIAIEECDAFCLVAHKSDSFEATLKWRSLTTKGVRLRTGWSQPYLLGSGMGVGHAHVPISMPDIEQTSTIREPDNSWQETTMDLEEGVTAAYDFLQHSLIFHDTLLSSQVAQDTVADHIVSSSSFLTTSFDTTASGLSSPNRIDGQTLILQLPPKMATTSIGSFPSALQLRSIYPQTPTPNTICVLMASPERREVFVRKGGYKMDLYELTVGDNTKAGFKVTFWLRPPRQSNNERYNVQRLLVPVLDRIKVGDILLLRNIALTYFHDTVYGQSLHPAIARARTTIDVLMKGNGVSVGQLGELSAAALKTFMVVRKWARSHVAAAESGSKKRRGTSTWRDSLAKGHLASSTHDESLPPDTLESV